MNMNEIKEVWNAQKIINPKYSIEKSHDHFVSEFVKKTVLKRLLKPIIKTSTDKEIVGLAEVLDQMETDAFDFSEENMTKNEIKTNANTGEVIGTPKLEEKPKKTNPFAATEKFSDEELNEIEKEEEQIEEAPADYDPFA